MRSIGARWATVLVAVVMTLATNPVVSGGATARELRSVERPGLSAPKVSAPEPGPYRIQNRRTGRCLDVSHTGVVEYRNCVRTDTGQHWIIWNGGWVKNQYTQRCNAVTEMSYPFLQSGVCLHDAHYYWRYWTPEWFQNVNYPPEQSACLVDDPAWSNGHRAMVATCMYDLRYFWTVSLW